MIDYQPIALMTSLSTGIDIAILEYILTLSPEKLGRTYESFMKDANRMLREYASDNDFSPASLELLRQYIANSSQRTGGNLRSTKNDER